MLILLFIAFSDYTVSILYGIIRKHIMVFYIFVFVFHLIFVLSYSLPLALTLRGVIGLSHVSCCSAWCNRHDIMPFLGKVHHMLTHERVRLHHVWQPVALYIWYGWFIKKYLFLLCISMPYSTYNQVPYISIIN